MLTQLLPRERPKVKLVCLCKTKTAEITQKKKEWE